MADRLTQLQDCLDDLATQMFASINYIQTRHAFAPIQNQPEMSIQDQATAASDGQQLEDGQQQQQPDKPEVFTQALRELARDLVLKEQQIEHLISVLPGIGSSEESQNIRIKALEKELREADEERREALRQRDRMLAAVSELAAECKRVY